MDYIHFIGIGAAVLTTVANFPQTYKIIREKSTDGISVTTYSMFILGYILWVIYGFIKTDIPVIAANGVSLVLCSIILILNFSPKETIENIHETVLPETVKEKVKEELREEEQAEKQREDEND